MILSTEPYWTIGYLSKNIIEIFLCFYCKEFYSTITRIIWEQAQKYLQNIVFDIVRMRKSTFCFGSMIPSTTVTRTVYCLTIWIRRMVMSHDSCDTISSFYIHQKCLQMQTKTDWSLVSWVVAHVITLFARVKPQPLKIYGKNGCQNQHNKLDNK